MRFLLDENKVQRFRQICIWLLTLLAASDMGGAGDASANLAAQGQEHHAGLVLQFANGSVQKYCLAFTGDSISGLDLLLKTGLDVKVEVYGGMGGEVCKIGHDGCDYPGQPCACQSYGPGGVYWTYHHLKGGQWKSSVVGAGSYKVHDGDVEGWAWSGGTPPQLFTFEQICGASLPQATHTVYPARATSTPLHPRATATQRPIPTQTRRSTATRTATTTEQPNVTNTRDTATAKATSASLVMSTSTPTEIMQPSATPAPTWTPVATATETSTPMPTPASASADNKDQSQGRTLAILAGFSAALAFALWRGLATIRSRNRGRNSHVD